MSDFASELAKKQVHHLLGLDETVRCDCDWAKRHPHERSDSNVAAYLRRLAERVDRGEIRHVSVSAHPVSGFPEQGDDDT